MDRRLTWVLVALFFLAGLYFRLEGLTWSLWLDEFFTLWAIEGGAVEAIERGRAERFFCLLVWVPVKLFGESEVVLRLPSLACALLTLPIVYRLGRELTGSVEVGLLAGALLWVQPAMADSGRIVRPYALGMLASAIFLWGFWRATRDGRWPGRVLFVVGGVALLYAHMMLALQAVGVAVAYFAWSSLREHYPPRRFALDVFVQLLLVLPNLSILVFHWKFGRHGGLVYMPLQVAGLIQLLALPLPLVLAGFLPAARERLAGGRDGAAFLWIVGFTQPVLALGLSLVLNPVTAPRYLMTLLIPISLLAARSLTALGSDRRGKPAALLLLGLYLGFATWPGYREPTGLWGYRGEDWRGAIASLKETVRETPGAPVVYRSGYITDNLWVEGPAGDEVFAPLRSPGTQAPDWRLVPATAWWNRLEGREGYFATTVEPALRDQPVFYFLSPDSDDGRDYAEHFAAWVEQRFPDRYELDELRPAEGILARRFRARR